MEEPKDFGHLSAACWAPVLRQALYRHLGESDSLGLGLTGLSLSPAGAMGVFELRLDDDPEVDFSFRLDSSPVSTDFDFSPLGSRAADLIHAWLGGSLELRELSSLWLELDHPRLAGSRVEPLLCARLADAVSVDEITGKILPRLHPSPIGDWRLRELERAIRNIPESSRLLYVFSLQARRQDAVRLELIDFSPEPLARYLEALTSFSSDPWRQAIRLSTGADRFHLSFDLLPDTYGSRFGLECSFFKQPNREPGWRALLDRLVDEGLCLPHKADALIDWAGFDSPRRAGDLWPQELRTGTLARCSSHVKLVARRGDRLRAKGYLLFHYQPDKCDPEAVAVRRREAAT